MTHWLTTIKKFLQNRFWLILLLIFYLAFSLSTYQDYGITNDEPDEFGYARQLYILWKTGDEQVKQLFSEKSNNEIDVPLVGYNRVYQTFLYVLNNQNSYEIYHLLNLLTATVFFTLVYELGLKISGKPRLSIILPLVLIFTPRYFGHLPTNVKDIPFAHFYLASLITAYLSFSYEPFRRRWWLRSLVLGSLFGLTQASRQVGFLIYFVYAFWLLIKLKEQAAPTDKRQRTDLLAKLHSIEVGKFFREMAGISAIGFLIQFITTPYLYSQPVKHFFDLLQFSHDFPWNDQILIWGRAVRAATRPLSYFPSWLLITTPVLVLVLAIGNWWLWPKFPKKYRQASQLIGFSLAINYLAVLLLRPVLYDGLRHLLYLVIHLSLLAGISLMWIIQQLFLTQRTTNRPRSSQLTQSTRLMRKLASWTIVGLLGLQVSWIASQYWLLHPYEYTFFNIAVGGIEQAQNYFETDYWGASYKEATQEFNHWVQQQSVTANFRSDVSQSNLNQINRKQLQCLVSSCGDPRQVTAYLTNQCQYVTDQKRADYLICHERINRFRPKALSEKLLLTVDRQGVIFNRVYQLE